MHCLFPGRCFSGVLSCRSLSSRSQRTVNIANSRDQVVRLPFVVHPGAHGIVQPTLPAGTGLARRSNFGRPGPRYGRITVSTYVGGSDHRSCDGAGAAGRRLPILAASGVVGDAGHAGTPPPGCCATGDGCTYPIRAAGRHIGRAACHVAAGVDTVGTPASRPADSGGDLVCAGHLMGCRAIGNDF
jgi:hypothetical protein